MKLTPQVVGSLERARVFKEAQKEVNSLDFSEDGTFLAAASDDEYLRIYNCNRGVLEQEIACKKFGIDKVRFTHNEKSVLCASKNDFDHSLRYLSLHDNKYIQFYKGHRDRVVSLSVSPRDDTFVSAALDSSVRFWDLRTNVCQGKIQITGRAAVEYDPSGVILAVGSAINFVRLYDVRQCDKGPFATFLIDCNPLDFLNIAFSPNGKYMLVTTDRDLVLMDSFDGKILHAFNDFSNEGENDLEASFSPDGQYITCGSDNGKVHIWSAEDKFTKIKELDGHVSAVRAVKWNPKYSLLASSCQNTCFWLPTITAT